MILVSAPKFGPRTKVGLRTKILVPAPTFGLRTKIFVSESIWSLDHFWSPHQVWSPHQILVSAPSFGLRTKFWSPHQDFGLRTKIWAQLRESLVFSPTWVLTLKSSSILLSGSLGSYHWTNLMIRLIPPLPPTKLSCGELGLLLTETG